MRTQQLITEEAVTRPYTLRSVRSRHFKRSTRKFKSNKDDIAVINHEQSDFVVKVFAYPGKVK